ncbi:hypothetical protein M0R19_02435 [Candidatus Pacearchaeota archaeon]|jgi:Fe-S-cluster containining protein|nr:hypothetical protein [Candidatus Pacearchaeota archaeon]
MIIESKIREWQQEKLTNYCGVCKDNCCNAKKHNILLNSFSLPLFEENGIPIIEYKQLISLNDKICLKDGSIIQKPSILQCRNIKEWVIYSDFCPFYAKGEGCKVHEDPRRPEVCREYPLAFFGCNDAEGKYLDVKIMKSCEYFNKKEVQDEFKKKFPVRFID